MPTSYYLPASDKEKSLWLKNFASKFPNYNSTFGFTSADNTIVQNDSVAFAYILDQLELIRSESQKRTSYKNILRDGPLGATIGIIPVLPVLPPAPSVVGAGIFPRIASYVGRIKKSLNYTEAIGYDLGIEGSAVANLSVMEIKPTISLKSDGGNVVVKYNKGKFKGIQLLSKRQNEEEFTLLSVVTLATYKDTRPNVVKGTPETRKYCAWYIDNDELTGQCSDEVSILV